MCTGSHPFIPAENTAYVQIVQSMFGQTVVNDFHFQKIDPWSRQDIADLADAASTAWAGAPQAQQSTGIALQFVRATDIGVDNSWQTEDYGDTGETGELTAPAEPGNVALAIKFTTGHAGRSYRGRIYFAGLDSTLVTGNEVDSGYRDDIVSAIELFVSDVETAMACEHVVVSYCQEGEWLTDAVVTEITDYGADVFVDSQRRRLTGRGV